MRLQGFRQLRVGMETPIYILLFGLMAIQIALPLRINFIVSLGTWAIFISTIVAFVITAMARKNRDRYFLIIIALIVTVALSMLCSFSISYQNFVVALSFLEIPLFMVAYPSVNNENIRKTIYRCFVILSVYYILVGFTSLANVYYTKYGERQMEFLTLGYNNPNETAMYLFACLIVLVAMWVEIKSIAAKIFVVVDIALVGRLLWLTLSRTGALMSALFLVLVICLWKVRIPKIIRIVSILIPLIFLLVTFIFDELLLYWSVMGETLETGRADIYVKVLDKLNVIRFLVGGYEFNFKNLHNALWTVFATVGILGAGTYFWFINAKIRDVHQSIKDKGVGKVALIGLLCIFIYTSTEAAFLTSGGTFAAIVISIYLLSVSDLRTIGQEDVESLQSDDEAYNTVLEKAGE